MNHSHHHLGMYIANMKRVHKIKDKQPESGFRGLARLGRIGSILLFFKALLMWGVRQFAGDATQHVMTELALAFFFIAPPTAPHPGYDKSFENAPQRLTVAFEDGNRRSATSLTPIENEFEKPSDDTGIVGSKPLQLCGRSPSEPPTVPGRLPPYTHHPVNLTGILTGDGRNART